MVKLTKDHIYELIALSPEPISKKDIIAQFPNHKGASHKIEEFIETLEKDGRIFYDNKGTTQGFKSKAPWANISYATVGEVKNGRFTLDLEGLTDDIPVHASMSAKKAGSLGVETGDRVLVRLHRYKGYELSATFMEKVAEDQVAHISGTFKKRRGNKSFRPDNQDIKAKFNIAAGSFSRFDRKKHVIAELPSSFDMRNPEVYISRDQDKDLVTGAPIAEILARKFRIDRLYPTEALREVEELKKQRIRKKTKGRKDLTHIDFITVDPPGAKDLDDAVFVERTDYGYRSMVAIADVPYWVRRDSELDKDARQRGISYYFNDRVLNMLPPELSQNKCSLLPNVNRYAIVLEERIDHDGNTIGVEAHAAVIRSREQLTYGQFYDRLDSNDPDLEPYKELHELRKQAGKTRHEAKTIQDVQKGDPVGYASTSFIETAMVNANIGFVEALKDSGLNHLFRNNAPSHSPAVYEDTRQALADLGYNIPEDPEQCNLDILHKVLDQAHSEGKGPQVEDLINFNLVDRAFYSTKNVGHFSLKLPFYTHATSPIRRYADIITLRAIHTMLGNEELGLGNMTEEEMEDIARSLNITGQRDKDISRDLDRYHSIHGLKRYEDNGYEMRAQIGQISEQTVEVMLVNGGMVKRLHESELPQENCFIDKESRELVFTDDNGAETHRLKRGDSVSGHIKNVDPSKAQWNFEISRPKPPRKKAPKPQP